MENNGFEDIMADYSGFPYAAHAFAQKEMSNDKKLVVVAIRGSHSTWDWITDILMAFPKGFVGGNHYGFDLHLTGIHKNLEAYLGGSVKKDGNTQYFITGHSMAGGVANLLAKRLADSGVSKSDIFCYTFACPDVAMGGLQSFGGYTNIHNICNIYDPVTLVPGNLGPGFALTPGLKWGKFGNTHWYSPGGIQVVHISWHDIIKDLDYVAAYTIQSFKMNITDMPGQILKGLWGIVTWILCPSNIEVIDKAGKTVATIINNKADYKGSVFGDVILLTVEDHKVIFLRGDAGYTFRLIGTDDGTMEVKVADFNLATGEEPGQRTFQNIALAQGKKLSMEIGGSIETPNVQLFVVDNQGNATSEVQPDGTETLIVQLPPIEAFITRLYQNVMGRQPDTGGLAYWRDSLISGTLTGADICGFFYTCPEFLSKKMTDEQFITNLYNNCMGRAPDAGGMAYWLSILNAGATRTSVMVWFVTSPEFTAICKNYGIVRGSFNPPNYKDKSMNVTMFVARLYRLFLSREPEEGGLEYWCQQLLTNRSTGSTAANGFVNSAEFQNRPLTESQYVEIMYNGLMGRPSDVAGLAYWIDQINLKGRPVVFNGFITSPEWRSIMASYGIR